MVDAALIQFAVNKLGDAFINESIFLPDVRKQVEELRDELRRMQCFLKDADSKQQQGHHRVHNWVTEIRNLAYDAEDVVDTFMLEIGAAPKSGGVLSFFEKKALVVKVGEEIKAIQSELTAISASTVTYGIKELPEDKPSSSIAPLRNHYQHVQDEDVTGLEEHTKTLLTELQKDEQRRCVVSIVGVGGLGKTTLAKKLFNHDTVMRHFDCRAWCSISQQLNTRGVLLELINELMNPNATELSKIKDRNDGSLVKMLSDYLQDEQYLIVVDDLWSFQDWCMLSPAFPNGKRGSKILLTTRNRDVALQADPWSLQLEPKLLDEEESWELLCKKAFPKATRETNCYPAGLEKLGREMVHKCGGLPLAICVLGGIISTKREDIKEWRYVHRSLTSNINVGVMGILALSYNDLPVHLKPCFLYFGLFPEDYAIRRKKLIQLWIAEGFIQQTKEDALVTLEDVGKRKYYGELIQRCMIQADKDPGPWRWRGKSCRMHDLMRELCLSKGKELNFLDIYDHSIDGTTCNSSGRRLRRYAINLNDEPRYGVDFRFNSSASALRTLLVKTKLRNPVVPLMKYEHIKLLRVLDLGRVKLDENKVKVVFELIHLRYLEIWGLDILKSSVGNLRNLQTLKLGGGKILEMIANLFKSRHLKLGGGCDSFELENLINLRTLNGVPAGKWIRKGCFRKLSKLQNLSVDYASRSQTDILIYEVSNKKSSSSSSSDDQYQNPIRVLELRTTDCFDNQIFDSISCCHNLHRIQLEGTLDGGLNFQKYPLNLNKLILIKSRLEKDPMETLQHLPNLKLLELYQAFEGEEMVCSAKGFPQLQVLNIENMKQLKKWTINQGGMPCLKELELSYLGSLSMLPEGLRYITTLKKLTIGYGMPTIKQRIVREVGEDWYKVQHIPTHSASPTGRYYAPWFFTD